MFQNTSNLRYLKYSGLTFIFHTDMVISGIGSAIRTLLIIQGYLRHRKKISLKPKSILNFLSNHSKITKIFTLMNIIFKQTLDLDRSVVYCCFYQ